MLLETLRKLHARSAVAWNREDGCTGRQCWCRCADRRIRSDAHFHASRNYIHHNPVKHGYVTRWQDWPLTSARAFLAQIGREEAQRLWTEYPVLEMGQTWDP